MKMIKVIGGHFRHDNGKSDEIDNRILAGRKAWASLRKVWSRPLPRKLLLIAYNSTVESTLFSGLESRAL